MKEKFEILSYHKSASDFIKSFGDPQTLIVFICEASQLTARFLFDKKEEINISANDFDSHNFRILQFLDCVAVNWLSNLSDPTQAVADGIRYIVECQGVHGLQEMAELTSCAYEYGSDKGALPAYQQLRAMNQLVYNLLSGQTKVFSKSILSNNN